MPCTTMGSTTRLLSLLVAGTIVSFVGISLASAHSLTADQCQATVRNIGKALKTEQESDTVLKGTWVSPRCELRRIQSQVLNGQKTSFLLRMIDIPNRRRWSGNYYFYNAQDCRDPVYAVEMQGHITTKGGITFNISTIKVALYGKGKELQMNYNNSCPGSMKLDFENGNTRVYSVDKLVPSNVECLKAIGLDLEEFKGALFQTHTIDGNKVTRLLQKSVDLLPSKGTPRRAQTSQQWSLQQHTTPMCLTCIKVGLGRLRHPPKLYARNSSSIDGTWGSGHCQKEGRGVYTTRFDKISGNTFERSVYVLKSSECKEASFRLRSVGTLRLVGDSLEVPGGVVYEMTIKKAFLTVYTESMARIFGISKGSCGTDTWEKGKTQDLGPTNGCLFINYIMGPPELVVIRAVLDENRNELYFGTDLSGKRNKGGPVTYNSISQDCARFPVFFAKPTQAVEITEAPIAFETTPVYFTTEKLTVDKGVVEGKKDKSNTVIIRGFIELVLLFFVLVRVFV